MFSPKISQIYPYFYRVKTRRFNIKNLAMLADRGSEPGFGVLTGSMSGLPSSRCRNCSAAFTNLSEKTCPSCGRVRAERTTTGFVESSYRVRTRQGEEIGPLPLATVAQMLRDGVIDSDSPIKDEALGKVIFADQHPLLRAALEQPPTSPTRQPHSLVWSITGAIVLILLASALLQYITWRRETDSRQTPPPGMPAELPTAPQ